MASQGPASPGEEAKLKFDLAKDSYHEVLSATEHQDGKVGRFIAAIAFLTGGGISFASRSEHVALKYDIGGEQLPLPAIALALFLGFILMSVVFFVIALGPNLTLPGRTGEARGQDRQPSLLFFLSIASRSLQDWESEWKQEPEELQARVTQNYIRETHNIAWKVKFKSARSNEGRAFFTIGLLFLAYGMALILLGIAEGPATGTPIPFGLWAINLIAVISAGFVFTVGFDFWRLEVEDPALWSSPRRHRGLWLALSSVVFVVCLAYSGRAGWLIAAALLALVPLRVALPRNRVLTVVVFLLAVASVWSLASDQVRLILVVAFVSGSQFLRLLPRASR